MITITPRPYQSDAIDSTRLSMRTNRSVLLVMPTGAGKTVTFTAITQSAMAKGSRIWIIAHRKELISQASKTLTGFGVPHGVISPHWTPSYQHNVQVASVQTLVNRMSRYPDPDIIIIDEAHHSTAGQWRKVIDAYPNAKIIGVTATPERSDGVGLSEVYEDIVIGPQIYELIEMGYLVEPIVYRPPGVMDLTSVKRHKSDYVREDLARAMNKPQITGDAIEHYKRNAYGQPSVAFCVNVKHAEDTAQQFREAGFRAYSVDGSMNDSDRERILNGLADGSVQVVTSCDIISEGTDIPAIACAILLRPTQSVGLYIQQVGRALRTLEGKTNAIIHDHVGNTLIHGMPTMHRDWTLEGRVRKSKGSASEADIMVTTCTACYYTAMKFDVCPQCGNHVPVFREELKIVDGELERAEDEVMKARKALRQEVGMAKTLDDLILIEKQRGYKRGWALNIIKAREKNRVL